MESITATDAARRLSDLLNRVRYRHETFSIRRNGEEVARLVPPSRPAPTLRDVISLIRERGRQDETFGDDLLAIQAAQPSLPDDPWRS